MKVLLVSNYEADRQQSMLRFTRMLQNGLSSAGIDVHSIYPQSVAGRYAAIFPRAKKWMGYVDKFALFPPVLRQLRPKYDLIHVIDQGNAMYLSALADIPHLITCHDLLAVRSARGEFPENPTGWTGRRLQAMILKGLRQARHVAFDSTATRRDFLRLVDPEALPGRTPIIAPGLNYDFRPIPHDEAGMVLKNNPWGIDFDKISPGFILHVGGNQWYKNRSAVIDIFAHLRNSGSEPWKLIMAGAPPTEELALRTQSLRHLGEDIHFISDVPDASLRALYSLAECLLFPSREEGFGWPAAEAHACGCRVLLPDKAPMSEVGGTAAVYIPSFDLENYSDWIAKSAESLRATLEAKPALREESVQAGLRNAKRFAPQRMIQQYIDFYRMILNAPAS